MRSARLYETEEDRVWAYIPFLGRADSSGETLPSFGINEGGYIGFFDRALGRRDTYSMAGDAKAQARLAAKRALAAEGVYGGRRALRIGGWPREKDAPVRAARATAPLVPKMAPIQAYTADQAARAVQSRCKRRFEPVAS